MGANYNVGGMDGNKNGNIDPEDFLGAGKTTRAILISILGEGACVEFEGSTHTTLHFLRMSAATKLTKWS